MKVKKAGIAGRYFHRVVVVVEHRNISYEYDVKVQNIKNYI